MPNRVRKPALTALTFVLGVLLCLAGTASGVAITSPTKTASGDFFGVTPFGTGEIVEETLQPRRGEAASLTELAPGRRCWLSPDPIAENGGSNLYGYSYNDPINYFDPDGRTPFLIIPAVGFIYLALTEQADAPDPVSGPTPAPDRCVSDFIGAPGEIASEALTEFGVPPQVASNLSISKASRNTAKKLLREYKRLLEKLGKKMPQKKLEELDNLRDCGTIKSSDLPGSLQNEFPPELKNVPLKDIDNFGK